jgi:hypothetical protein
MKGYFNLINIIYFILFNLTIINNILPYFTLFYFSLFLFLKKFQILLEFLK